jgi:RND family efflux transporter MFP subunit
LQGYDSEVQQPAFHAHKVERLSSEEIMTDLKAELASLRIDREPKPRPRWRWLGLMVFLVLIAGGLGFYFIPGSSLTAAEVETVRPTVQTFSQVAAGSPILTASGYIVARRQAVVSAKIQGRLSDLRVEEGSHVREGEVIARLESSDYEAQVQVAQAQVQHAEADLAEQQRQLHITEKLTQARVDSQDQLDAATSRVRLAEAALAQSRASLGVAQASYQNTLIRAPFTGVVVKKMAEVGESVAPIPPGVNISTASGAIVALADMATLEAEVDVSESNVARLQSDQPAEVSVEAFPDRSYKAVLRQIIPTADRTKATVTVKVTLLDKDKDLKPEMTAKATFFEQKKKDGASLDSSKPIISVPKDAIATREGKAVVFEVRNDRKVYERPITAGIENQDQVVIKQGLAGSETLVLHPSDKLKDGDAVKTKS